ncbi:bromodomain-containing protein [Anaeramoeba flamelloides]|uniref:Bromodomain-containing protein n=1 Tax=Anaeramoeba flamelloides TaxID=1746091 RepID=A0AAV7YIY0_9EUKA|nr:bromodomain-containing protein [Anaeramoeba flamelloides]
MTSSSNFKHPIEFYKNKKGVPLYIELCRKLLRMIAQKPNAFLFKNPVSQKTFPQYYQTIKKPMFIKTVRSKLRKGEYHTLDSFVEDVKLIFKNAMTFNLSNQLYQLAKTILQNFEKRLKIEKDLLLKTIKKIEKRKKKKEGKEEEEKEEKEKEEQSEEEEEEEEKEKDVKKEDQEHEEKEIEKENEDSYHDEENLSEEFINSQNFQDVYSNDEDFIPEEDLRSPKKKKKKEKEKVKQKQKEKEKEKTKQKNQKKNHKTKKESTDDDNNSEVFVGFESMDSEEDIQGPIDSEFEEIDDQDFFALNEFNKLDFSPQFQKIKQLVCDSIRHKEGSQDYMNNLTLAYKTIREFQNSILMICYEILPVPNAVEEIVKAIAVKQFTEFGNVSLNCLGLNFPISNMTRKRERETETDTEMKTKAKAKTKTKIETETETETEIETETETKKKDQDGKKGQLKKLGNLINQLSPKNKTKLNKHLFNNYLLNQNKGEITLDLKKLNEESFNHLKQFVDSEFEKIENYEDQTIDK